MYEGIERPDPIEVIELDRPAEAAQASFTAKLGRRSAVLRIAALVGAAGALMLGAALTMAASPSPSPTSGSGPTPSAPIAPGANGPWGGGHGMMGMGRGMGRGMDGGWMKGSLRGGQPGFQAITIASIDGSSVSLKTADGWTRTITVTSSTTITKSGQTIALGDLKVGDEIRFQETRNTDGTFSITAIEVVLPHVSGTVSALTSSGFTVRSADGSTTNVVVTSSTTYRLGRGSGTRADVKVGMEVAAQGSKASDGSITATTVRLSPAMVGGEVTAKTSTSITVRLPGGTTTTIKVSSATTYSVAGKSSASLADITVGMRIVAQGTLNADGSLQATTVGAMAFGGARGPWNGTPFMAPPAAGSSGTQG